MLARHIIARVLQAVPTLLGIGIVTFFLLRLTGDPESVMLPPDAPPEAVEAFRQRYGLDRPLPAQFVAFLRSAFVLDFGESIRYRVPVTSLLVDRVGPTALLALTSMALALLIGLPLGYLAGLRRGGRIDRLGRTLAFTGQSVPSFYLGILFILIFSVRFKAVPSIGPITPSRLIFPALTLATAMIPLILRVARGSVLDVARQNYVRTARAKGLSERDVLRHHIAKNAAIPVVTIVGLQLGSALSGAVVTETVFSWPGIGRFLMEAISTRDFPVVQAITILTATTYVVINLVVDVAYALLNPRIRYQ